MSRSDIPDIEDRRPFYLYVDEFQNFATDSFATILSEARKYGLNLTVANQYISQMSDTVRNAVFGNVGTMITFRVSADDSPILAKQFEPQFEATDLLQMHNRNFVINMVINGEKSPAFSARTLNLPPAQTDNTEHIVENTRRLYSRARAEVEEEISAAINKQNNPQQQAKAPLPAPAPKQWPINAQTNVITPDSVTVVGESTAPEVMQQPQLEQPATAALETGDTTAPAKKKRRRRKKKPAGSAEGSNETGNSASNNTLPAPVASTPPTSSEGSTPKPAQATHSPKPLSTKEGHETEIKLR